MKILLVNKFFYFKGGAETSFFQMARLLEEKGHKVSFFSMQHPRNLTSPFQRYFVSNIDYESELLSAKIKAGLNLLYSREARMKISRLIEAEKPDIVHLNNICHQISPSILSAIKRYNLPVVMSLRDYKIVCPAYSMLCGNRICHDCRGGKYYHCFLRRCVKRSRLKSLLNTMEMYLHHNFFRFYNRVDTFISPSKFLKSKIKEMGFSGNIVYLPNFVNIEEFKPGFDWQDDCLVYFGRLSGEKGLVTLIDAVKNINRIFLKIIGEGPMEESLRRKIKREGLTNIRLLGYKIQEALKDEIRRSMFVVLPSECYENNPRAIIEGFALGKPALGAKIGGIPELVQDGVTGFTFTPTSVKDLTAKIALFLNCKDKLISMGRNARRLIEETYTSESHYQKLIEIYQGIGHRG